jgi:hypothetical protein
MTYRARLLTFSNSRFVIGALLATAIAACGSDSTGPSNAPGGFIGGTSDNHEIGLVVNSTGKALTLFQLGSPATQKQIALGTSSTVTPTGLSIQGRRAAVPLGNAASVALIDLTTASISRIFTFKSGNATGSAFVDDTTLIVANSGLGLVGRVTVGQAGDSIANTVAVASQPTDIRVTGGRVLVTSANLDDNFTPIGNGVVTILDSKTLTAIGTVTTGGTNSTAAAVGPDNLLYVVNTGDYSAPSSLTIINPATAQLVKTVTGMMVGAGAISIDANGLAYISSFGSATAPGGTTVWNTKSGAFVRGPDNPVCAKVANGSCRGAFAATTSANGNLYQLFFGSTSAGLPPYAFIFKASTFALTDSVSVGIGPSALAIRTFQ